MTFKMGGKTVTGGAFAHSLRMNLYSEHLGLSFDEVKDPIDPSFVSKMNQIADVLKYLFF
jgi:hypothetical protein